MTAWQLIRTHLAADSNVTTLATGGIYPVRGKQNERRPQIVGRQSDGEDPEAIDSTRVMYTATLEIGCVAEQYDDAVDLAEAVIASLKAMRRQTVSGKLIGSVVMTGFRDEDYYPEANAIGRVFTVSIKFQ